MLDICCGLWYSVPQAILVGTLGVIGDINLEVMLGLRMLGISRRLTWLNMRNNHELSQTIHAKFLEVTEANINPKDILDLPSLMLRKNTIIFVLGILQIPRLQWYGVSQLIRAQSLETAGGYNLNLWKSALRLYTIYENLNLKVSYTLTYLSFKINLRLCFFFWISDTTL